MKHLNEDTIKRAGVRFLKNYYKFRPRTGNTVTSLDQETSDGIITDGLFTFIADDGNPFLATLEATSHESREEVLYSRQEKLLKWDSIVYVAFIAVIFFSLSHHYDWVTINKNGWLMTIFTLLAISLGAFYIVKSLISGFQRYRYIYAVEQFKKYHANEQWIAIADDVFDTKTDPYLQELKTQCVRNGFGLISVDIDEEARILISPSRQEVFGQERESKHFNNRDESVKYSKTQRVRNIWKKTSSRFSFRGNSQSLSRYERSFTSQMILSSIALLILSGIFYTEALNAPMFYPNERKYEQELSQKAKKSKPETEDYVLDSALVDRGNTNVKPYLEVSGNETDYVEDEDDFWDSEMEKYFDDYGENYAEIYISRGEGKYLSYDCERFFNYSGTKYLIQEGTYKDVNEARKQLIRLKKDGINAHCLWTGCLNNEDMEFIIFVDFLFDHKKEAGVILTNFRRRFQLKKGYFKIRSLTL